MEQPEDICAKYCKRRLQNLTDNKPCPFSLTSASVETEGEGLKIHTVCEGFVSTLYKTIIDRVVLITKDAVRVLKEVIKHEKQPTYGNKMWQDIPLQDPLQKPYVPPPIIQPELPFPPQYPWTVTYSSERKYETLSDKP